MIQFWITKRNLNWLKLTANTVVFSFLFSTLSAPFLEANIWDERRKHLQEKSEKQEKMEKAFNPPSSPASQRGEPFNKGGKERGNVQDSETTKDRGLRTDLSSAFGIEIPEEFGTVVESYEGKKEDKVAQLEKGALPTVIHIQDAHGVYAAQKNASSILKLLLAVSSDQLEGTAHNSPLTTHSPLLVCVEGAWGRVSPEWLSVFPEEKIKKELAESLLKEGEISGEEYLGILLPPGKMKLYGVEESEVYQANLKTRQLLDPERERMTNKLSVISERVSRLKKHLYPRKLLELDTISEQYETQKISLKEYFNYLSSHYSSPLAGEGGVRGTEKYPTLKILSDLLNEEENLSVKTVGQERDTLLQQLNDTLDNSTLTQLAQVSLNFRTGKMTAQRYYQGLMRLAEVNNIPVPQMRKYVEYLKKSQELNSGQANAELSQMERELFETISNPLSFPLTKGEYKGVANLPLQKLIEVNFWLRTQSKFWTEKMSPQDWEQYQKSDARSQMPDSNKTDSQSQIRNQQFAIRNFKDIETYLTQEEKRLNLPALSPSFVKGDQGGFIEGRPYALRSSISNDKPSATRLPARQVSNPPAGEAGQFSVGSSNNSKTLKLETRTSNLSSQQMLFLQESYYKLAFKRDQIMVEKTLQKAKELDQDQVVMIAGGFHTPGMTNILREKGVPYIVIRPKLTLAGEKAVALGSSPSSKPAWKENFMKALTDVILGSLRIMSTLQVVTGVNLTSSPIVFTPYHVNKILMALSMALTNDPNNSGIELRQKWAQKIREQAKLEEEGVQTEFNNIANKIDVQEQYNEGNTEDQEQIIFSARASDEKLTYNFGSYKENGRQYNFVFVHSQAGEIVNIISEHDSPEEFLDILTKLELPSPSDETLKKLKKTFATSAVTPVIKNGKLTFSPNGWQDKIKLKMAKARESIAATKAKKAQEKSVEDKDKLPPDRPPSEPQSGIEGSARKTKVKWTASDGTEMIIDIRTAEWLLTALTEDEPLYADYVHGTRMFALRGIEQSGYRFLPQQALRDISRNSERPLPILTGEGSSPINQNAVSLTSVLNVAMGYSGYEGQTKTAWRTPTKRPKTRKEWENIITDLENLNQERLNSGATEDSPIITTLKYSIKNARYQIEIIDQMGEDQYTELVKESESSPPMIAGISKKTVDETGRSTLVYSDVQGEKVIDQFDLAEVTHLYVPLDYIQDMKNWLEDAAKSVEQDGQERAEKIRQIRLVPIEAMDMLEFLFSKIQVIDPEDNNTVIQSHEIKRMFRYRNNTDKPVIERLEKGLRIILEDILDRPDELKKGNLTSTKDQLANSVNIIGFSFLAIFPYLMIAVPILIGNLTGFIGAGIIFELSIISFISSSITILANRKPEEEIKSDRIKEKNDGGLTFFETFKKDINVKGDLLLADALELVTGGLEWTDDHGAVLLGGKSVDKSGNRTILFDTRTGRSEMLLRYVLVRRSIGYYYDDLAEKYISKDERYLSLKNYFWALWSNFELLKRWRYYPWMIPYILSDTITKALMISIVGIPKYLIKRGNDSLSDLGKLFRSILIVRPNKTETHQNPASWGEQETSASILFGIEGVLSNPEQAKTQIGKTILRAISKSPLARKVLVWMGNPIKGAPKWESVFALPVFLGFIFGVGILFTIAVALASSFVFAGAHKGRSWKQRLKLSGVGLVLAGVTVTPAILLPVMGLGLPSLVTAAVAISVGIPANVKLHKTYNRNLRNELKDALRNGGVADDSKVNGLLEVLEKFLTEGRPIGVIKKMLNAQLEAYFTKGKIEEDKTRAEEYAEVISNNLLKIILESPIPAIASDNLQGKPQGPPLTIEKLLEQISEILKEKFGGKPEMEKVFIKLSKKLENYLTKGSRKKEARVKTASVLTKIKEKLDSINSKYPEIDLAALLFEYTRWMLAIDQSGETGVILVVDDELSLQEIGIELDVPISIDGKIHIHETKHYTTNHQYGIDVGKQSQPLKYQKAIEEGRVGGATIEVKGLLSKEFLEWAKNEVPDVEIIYTLELIDGSEVRFVLQEPRNEKRLPFIQDEMIAKMMPEYLTRKGVATPAFIEAITEFKNYDEFQYSGLIKKFNERLTGESSAMVSAEPHDDNEGNQANEGSIDQLLIKAYPKLAEYLKQYAADIQGFLAEQGLFVLAMLLPGDEKGLVNLYLYFSDETKKSKGAPKWFKVELMDVIPGMLGRDINIEELDQVPLDRLEAMSPVLPILFLLFLDRPFSNPTITPSGTVGPLPVTLGFTNFVVLGNSIVGETILDRSVNVSLSLLALIMLQSDFFKQDSSETAEALTLLLANPLQSLDSTMTTVGNEITLIFLRTLSQIGQSLVSIDSGNESENGQIDLAKLQDELVREVSKIAKLSKNLFALANGFPEAFKSVLTKDIKGPALFVLDMVSQNEETAQISDQEIELVARTINSLEGEEAARIEVVVVSNDESQKVKLQEMLNNPNIKLFDAKTVNNATKQIKERTTKGTIFILTSDPEEWNELKEILKKGIVFLHQFFQGLAEELSQKAIDSDTIPQLLETELRIAIQA